MQFLFLTVFLLFLNVIGVFYPGSGNSLYTAALILYALTAGIAGFIAASFYKQIGGEKWAWNIVLTACVFAVPFLFMALVVRLFFLFLLFIFGSSRSFPCGITYRFMFSRSLVSDRSYARFLSPLQSNPSPNRAFSFPLRLGLRRCQVNIIAGHYEATTSISFGTIMLIMLIWAGRASLVLSIDR